MRNKRFVILLCSVLFSSLCIMAQNKAATYHTIQKGETLYRLTQIYQVTAEAICALNPGLSAENFQAGKTIAIPSGNGQVEKKKQVEVIQSAKPEGVADNCQTMHKVKKKETIYGLAQTYGVTEDDIRNANPELKDPNATLKKGQFICIPYKTIKVIKEVEPENEELFASSKPTVSYYARTKIALMLPFSTADKTKKSSSTMYYRGFMLAIDNLKNEGIDMEVTICDTGKNEEKVDSLLKTNSLKEANLIFSPLIERSEHKLSDFSKRNQTRLVLSQSGEVNTNPYMFTINTSNGLLFDDAIKFYMKKFSNANIILVDMGDTNEKTLRKSFTTKLKTALGNQNLSYKIVNLSSSTSEILKAMDKNKVNLFVPNSANLPLMKKLLNKWKKLVEENTNYRISMLGHREWLSLASEMKSLLYTCDTYIYSKYWFNPGNAASKELAANYQKWFSEKLPTLMPSVPAVGYDTAYYMIKGLSKYGTSFENNLKNMEIKPYQNFIDFERMGNGGYANTKVGIVHFNKKLVNVEF